MHLLIYRISKQFASDNVPFFILNAAAALPLPTDSLFTFDEWPGPDLEITALRLILFLTFGSVINAVLLYGMGAWLETERLENVIARWGSFAGLTKSRIQKAENWFETYGNWAIFFCRFIPLLKVVVSLPAGLSKMNFSVFLCLTALGASIWNTLLVYSGIAVGSGLTLLAEGEPKSAILLAGLVCLIVVLFLCFIWKRGKKKS